MKKVMKGRQRCPALWPVKGSKQDLGMCCGEARSDKHRFSQIECQTTVDTLYACPSEINRDKEKIS